MFPAAWVAEMYGSLREGPLARMFREERQEAAFRRWAARSGEVVCDSHRACRAIV
jgi:hypothetical protein